MITLVTGTPGAGKTLWTVKELISRLIPLGRDIYTNIDGLNVDADHVYSIQAHEMHHWQSYPDGSIFIYDECQEQFPPRHATAKVPDYIGGFQTHRHRGMDFYLVTQEPTLIDKAIRVLVGRHVHLYRPMGLKRSQVFEWPTVNSDPNPSHSSSSAKRNQFIFPKSLYSAYKSASSHTHTVNLPWGLIGLVGGSLVLIAASFWWFLGSMFGDISAASAEPVPVVDPKISETGAGSDAVQASFSCFLMGRVGSMYLIKQDSGPLFAVSRTQLLEQCNTMH